MNEFQIQGIVCRIADSQTAIHGQSTDGVPQAGLVTGAVVATPDGGTLEVGLTDWASGEADIQSFSRLSGPIAYDWLVKRLRIGVHRLDDGTRWCELRMLYRATADALPTARKAIWAEFDALLGQSAAEWLKSLGPVQAGTREELFNETNKRRYELALATSGNDLTPLFGAYVLTRVLPVLKGFQEPEFILAGQA